VLPPLGAAVRPATGQTLGGKAGSGQICVYSKLKMGQRRFALVCPDYHPWTCGVGDHSMRLGQELERRGHEVAIFTRGRPTPHPEAPAIPVTGVAGASALAIAHRLVRHLRDFQPTDVVVQYTPHMLGASRWGSLAIPHIVRSMGDAHTVLLAHELFLPWSGRPDLALGAASLRMQISLLMRMVDRTLVTMDGRIGELAAFTRLLGLPQPGVVRVGPNALPVPARPVAGRLRLGVFSTLANTKRFDIVLDCFGQVARLHPQAELVLLGDLGKRNDFRAQEFHAAVERHPAAARIRVPGRLELADIAREIAEIDVYLFPMVTGANTRSGTLPVALGSGLPVVAIRGIETDRLFVDGENVLLAEALTPAAFADASLRLIRDAELRSRVSAGARRLYEESLSWEKITDQFLAQA
jgi:glycosyltransferase involved in cell wall biosynthesis